MSHGDRNRDIRVMPQPLDFVLRKLPSGCVLFMPGWLTSAGKLADYSGNSNHGTITGATRAVLPSGLWGLRYDGNDYININSVLTQLATTTKGTWMTWVELDDATPVATTIFISFGDTNANEILYLGILTSGIIRAFSTVANVTKWQLDTTAAVLSDGRYSHVALIQDGVSPVLLVNGVQVAQTFSVSSDKTTWFSVSTGLDNGRIGCRSFNNGGNEAFITNGNLALPKLITTNLTVAQVLNDFQQSRHLLGV